MLYIIQYFTSIRYAVPGGAELFPVVRAALRVAEEVAPVRLLAFGTPHVLHGEGAAREATVVGEGSVGGAYRLRG